MVRDNISVPPSRVKKSKKSKKLARETRGLCRERHGWGQLSEYGTANGDAPAWEREEVSTWSSGARGKTALGNNVHTGAGR
jgi:hypothetical protein